MPAAWAGDKAAAAEVDGAVAVEAAEVDGAVEAAAEAVRE